MNEDLNYITSDYNLKYNIKNIENGLEIINKLRPVNYDITYDIDDSSNLINTSGFIAQDIYKIHDLSHNIHKGGIDEDGSYRRWFLSYNGFNAFYVSSIQDLDKKRNNFCGKHKCLFNKKIDNNSNLIGLIALYKPNNNLVLKYGIICL